MRAPMTSTPRRRELVYTGLCVAIAGLLMLTGLRDERLSVDRQCVKYASPKACRVF